MNYKREIGRRIKAAREGLGLSQSKLAARTDNVLSASRIANYEQGSREPGVQEIRILAKALGQDPAYLMCLEDESEMTPQERQLLRDFSALPENERGAYARRISALALAYKEPVADERVPVAFNAKAKRKLPRKVHKS